MSGRGALELRYDKFLKSEYFKRGILLTKWPGGSEGANDLISFLEYYREAGAQVDIINMNENHSIIKIMIFFLNIGSILNLDFLLSSLTLF